MTTTLDTEPAPPSTTDGDREIPLAPEPPPATEAAVNLGYSVGFDISQVSPIPDKVPGPRLMPRTGLLDAEPLWKRALYFLVMAAILVGYSYMLSCYWSPAHPGINQNGYLVGGKNLAEYGTMGMKLTEPYEHLGWMWNLVDRDPGPKEDIWFYPKYPIGTGALFAACLKISQWKYGNWEAGKLWSFWVNPAGAVLAVAAMFMLLRQFAGSFAAVLGAMILGSCQVLLSFAEQPLSHGPALACVTWGMYFLLRWWQTASIWRGILAGLFLGYAVTIRYTEGLLILPLAAVLISMVRYDVRATRWWSMSIVLAAAITGVIANNIYDVSLDGWRLIAPLISLGVVLGALFEYKRGGFTGRKEFLAALARMFVVAGVAAVVIFALRKHFKLMRTDRATFELIIVAGLALLAAAGIGVQWWLKSDAWVRRTGEWLRLILAAGLIYFTIYFLPQKDSGIDVVGRQIESVIVKTFLLGTVALLFLVPWSQPRRYIKLAVPALAWLVPTGILLAYNYAAMGSFSGYDTTNESTAFTWRTFTDKWDDTVQQIYDYSMYLIPPLALAGLFLMYRWSWRAALLVTLWLVPGMLLYIAYYFGKQRPGMWYLRFFLTLFPPMVIAAMWLLKSAAEGMRERIAVPATVSGRERIGRARGSVAVPLGLGVFTYCSCAVGLMISVPSLEREHASNINLAYTSDQIVRTIKKYPTVLINDKVGKPVVFAEGRANPNGPLCNFLQFSGDFELYPSDGFTGGAGMAAWRDAGDNQPNPMQKARQDWLNTFFRSKSDAEVAKDQNRIMSRALDEGRYVFAALQPGVATFFRNRFVTPGGFEMSLIAQWREPAKVPMERSTSQLDPLSRGMPLYPTRASQTWHLYRITRKPVVKTPATPTTGPTTKPTQVAEKTPSPTTNPTKTVVGPTTAPAKQTVAPALPQVTPPSGGAIFSVLEKLHVPGFGKSPATQPSKP